MKDKKKIEAAIMLFFKTRQEFRGRDLVTFCKAFIKSDVYEDTPKKYMRMLRNKGKINYIVKNKAESLYKIIK